MLNRKEETTEKKYNCRDATICPPNCNCLVENVIYSAKIKSEKVYILFLQREHPEKDLAVYLVLGR